MKISKKTYWKGIEQLKNDPQFIKDAEKEFPEYLSIKDAYGDNSEDSDSGTSRRDFLKLMGFSVAAVTLAACEPPIKKAIPYLNKPETIEPGVPNYYASTYSEGGEYCAVVVKTREGRPIFVEGNKMSSLSQGGVNSRVSASVLSLYDDEKSKHASKGGKKIDWKTIDKEISSKLTSAQNVYLVSNTIISPSTKRLIREFGAKYSNFKHITYDPNSFSGMLAAHAKKGTAAIPSFDFSKADTIVSFDADFLGAWISQVEHTKQYSKSRKVSPTKKTMSRHYQFEARYSMTGANADHRVLVKPSEQAVYIANLYNLIALKAGRSAVNAPAIKEAKGKAKLTKCANDLWASKAKSIVVSGSNNEGVQTLVMGINEMLGAYEGGTIDLDNASYQKQGNDAEMAQFVTELKGGNVGAVVFYNANPVYDHPQGKDIAAGLTKTKVSISTADRLDETTAKCTYHTPDSHYLESWNDAEPKRGHFGLCQPTIRTIYNTRQAQSSFMTWAGMEGDFVTYIQEHWKANVFTLQSEISDFNIFWKTTLHDGLFEAKAVAASYKSIHEGGVAKKTFVAVVADSLNVATENTNVQEVVAEETVTDTTTTTIGEINWATAASEALLSQKKAAWEFITYSAPVLGDGRQANNPWIQESPDPISKMCWGHYASISTADAKTLGLDAFTMDKSKGRVPQINLTINGQDLGNFPIVAQPGQANGTVAVATGYGRGKGVGKVALEAGGVSVYPFVGAKNSATNVNAVEGNVQVAQTQTHETFLGRNTIIQEATLADYKDAKKFKADRFDTKIASSKGKTPAEDLSLWDIDSDGYANFDEKEKKASELAKQQWKVRHGNQSDKHAYPIHHWGMAIDLNSCTGCAACLTACSLENNVPIVGKDEVGKRREMHWMRIDRYYASEEGATTFKELERVNQDEPEVVFQPMMCQHCNNATCETVCPVAATTHSSEGLNQMTYNRCVGTKYCANNCPYKVRRFNWFKYHSNSEFDYHLNSKMGRMVLNPDVMVRSRGVMEKCSMCVQRIQAGKLAAKREKRKVVDGEVVTACASACPADAITFGDLNDSTSEVSKLIESELETGRAYNVLAELNVSPNVWYLTKVRNKG
jgi:molybdopterin-containing oxidoreductase family iron-sulfur binding subunit